MSLGKNITSADNDKAFLEANDEIRGVKTVCHGDCPNGDCIEEDINIHDITWKPLFPCSDGGVIRSFSTYTNLDVSGFKTDVGYSGHYYGIRKYDGLIPNAPYHMVMHGKTSTLRSIPYPIQFTEVEYGINDYVGYSGVSFDGISGEYYGKSISVHNNIMAVGAPYKTINYTEYDENNNLVNFNLEKTGSVYLYFREDRPSGSSWPIDKDSSPWMLDQEIILPSNIIKDYYVDTKVKNVEGVELPISVTKRQWYVGQEGGQFGHSVAVATSQSMNPSFGENDRKILVVGSPSSSWSGRNFESLNVSGVPIGLLLFTDEFSLDESSDGAKIILDSIKNQDLIFQYFSDPPVKFDLKVGILEPVSTSTITEPINFPEPKPSFIIKERIPRYQSEPNQQQTDEIFNGIKNNFHKLFPYDPTKINNNIPVILGISIDNSFSLTRASIGRGLDKFIDYYRNYSFASGLVNFYGERCSGVVVETKFVDTLMKPTESWIQAGVACLRHVLDTGRLVRENVIDFFTSGVGPEYFNNNLSALNFPPPSGGKVHIFEKESGVWNLIQTITQDVESFDSKDYFGHAVAISKNSKVITIGSPYGGQHCMCFEYNPTAKTTFMSRLRSWLGYKSSVTGGANPRYTSLISNYDKWVNQNGVEAANNFLYANLTREEKWDARSYLKIKEYKEIFRYNNPMPIHDDPLNTWVEVTQVFAPTSRLGYSTAVNDDGSIIAFGAPTDSFNVFDDGRIWYKNKGYNNKTDTSLNSYSPIERAWPSDVNAGAVRLFQSRSYYPHSKVIEYGKFGNLQESLNEPADSGHFNYLASIFKDKNFTKTPFSETEIPQDAGLVFIITPEIDAASDEIIDNIIQWLALGDRNLVLVGNDPIWESNGAYRESNEIINKILDKLDSRMRLVPARNKTEACVDIYSLGLPCVLPSNITPSYVRPVNVTVSGVADIRTNFDKLEKWKDLFLQLPCDSGIQGSYLLPTIVTESPNSRCELPLKNNGDLRAQWFANCLTCAFDITTFAVNYPFLYGTFKAGFCCDPDGIPHKDFILDEPGNEPIPLMAAGQIFYDKKITPAVPATSGFRTKYKELPLYGKKYTLDPYGASGEPSFYFTANSNNYLSYNVQPAKKGGFYVPEPFENRSGILQATSTPSQSITGGKNKELASGLFAAEQNYTDLSKIIVIASLVTETQKSIYSTYDQDINFYNNLVSKNTLGNNRAYIAQLGSWTGRTSFNDAKNGSVLHELFLNKGHFVNLNVSKLSSLDDVCWVANPLGYPDEEQLASIKSWLSLPNKKLIFTYDETLESAFRVFNIIKKLDKEFSPIYLEVEDKYLEADLGAVTINPNHQIGYGIGKSTGITSLQGGSGTVIPMYWGSGITPIGFIPYEYNTIDLSSIDSWQFNAKTTVKFPAIAGSGYRLFFTCVKENPTEKEKIYVKVDNVSKKINLPFPKTEESEESDSESSGQELDKLSDLEITSVASNVITKLKLDVQAVSGANSIDITFFNETYIPAEQASYTPKTVRLLSVSGIAIPITSTLFVSGTERVPDGKEFFSSPAKPEQVVTTSRMDFIKNLNDQYCPAGWGSICTDAKFNNQYIDDGPVVMAQEQEHLSQFSAGVARSRITLISDSSLVQGRAMGDDNFRISLNSISLIKSLYPTTNFPSKSAGRQYVISHKIISPERGSPGKYYSYFDNSGIIYRFGANNKVSGALPQDESAVNLNLQQPDILSFIDSSQYDASYVISPQPLYDPKTSEEERRQIIDQAIRNFHREISRYGATPKFSGVYNNVLYGDASFWGGVPDIMKDTGHDYLDFDYFDNLDLGYPGDLFGYSIALSKDKLIVGSPFNGFSSSDIVSWSGVASNASGLSLSKHGGAGSVYIFERTFNGSGTHGTKTEWECVQKLKPKSINIGQDLQNSGSAATLEFFGQHPYTNEIIKQSSTIGDRFGISVAIDSDIIAVGSPGHDFGNVYVNGTGNFIRKSFNAEFNIPIREVYNLGDYESRLTYGSGEAILNRGAIFTFENKIVDWARKSQKWTLIEKIVSDSGNYNDKLGSIVSIDRPFRSDSDYVIACNAINNKSYSYDIMLREQPPARPSELAFIDATLFGSSITPDDPKLKLTVYNAGQDGADYYVSGIIYPDEKGQIYIEASGQDPLEKGFIAHRPYIVSIQGKYISGSGQSDFLTLYTKQQSSGVANMPLFTPVDNSANVYTKLGLYNTAILGSASSSGLILHSHYQEPQSVANSGLNLIADGIGSVTDNLNLRIRGK